MTYIKDSIDLKKLKLQRVDIIELEELSVPLLNKPEFKNDITNSNIMSS